MGGYWIDSHPCFTCALFFNQIRLAWRGGSCTMQEWTNQQSHCQASTTCIAYNTWISHCKWTTLQMRLALFPGLLHFCSSVCVQYNTWSRRAQKVGKAWEHLSHEWHQVDTRWMWEGWCPATSTGAINLRAVSYCSSGVLTILWMFEVLPGDRALDDEV